MKRLGALFTAILLIAGTCAFWLWLLRGSDSTTQTYPRAPSKLSLDFTNAGIEISPGPPGEIRVERDLEWSINKPQVTEAWEGDTFRVRIRCGTFSSCYNTYKILVPPETSVVAATTSGHIDIRDLTGDLRVAADSGEISLRNTAGSLSATGGSGDVKISGSRSKKVTVENGSGDIKLTFREAPQIVHTRTGAGNIRIAVPPGDAYALTTESGSGVRAIEVRADPTATRTIFAKTGAGNIGVIYGEADPAGAGAREP